MATKFFGSAPQLHDELARIANAVAHKGASKGRDEVGAIATRLGEALDHQTKALGGESAPGLLGLAKGVRLIRPSLTKIGPFLAFAYGASSRSQ